MIVRNEHRVINNDSKGRKVWIIRLIRSFLIDEGTRAYFAVQSISSFGV